MKLLKLFYFCVGAVGVYAGFDGDADTVMVITFVGVLGLVLAFMALTGAKDNHSAKLFGNSLPVLSLLVAATWFGAFSASVVEHKPSGHAHATEQHAHPYR